MRTSRRRFGHRPAPLKVEINDPQAFQRDGRLHALARSVHVRRKIEQVVLSHLEPALRDHLHAVDFQDGVLSLIFDSAAFSARLRYRTEDLSRKLRKLPELGKLTRIRCVVRPPAHFRLTRPPRPPRRVISPETGRMIQDSAENFSDYEIRESIRRLAEVISRRQ